MLKNKLKIIALLAVIILTLTIPIVRAEEQDAIPTETSIDESRNETNATEATTQIDENLKQGDVYLSGDNVTIDYAIDGNLFVLANNVTINSQIAGDAFICANTVTIGESAYIFNNLFNFSKNINVNGIVYNLYVATENTTINGTVYRDLRVGSDTVNIFGMVGRDAYIDCENLNLTQNTNSNEENYASSENNIHGNLTYSSSHEANIPKSSVKGKITYNPEITSDHNTLQKQILSLGTFIATVIILWLICLWLTPKFLKNASSYITTKKILPVIGFGILAPLVSILLAILLFILGITSTIAIILLVTLFILMAISTSIFTISINTIICDTLKIQKTLAKFGMLLVCAILLWLISLIPYLGSFIGIITLILGLGTIISSLIFKEKIEETN